MMIHEPLSIATAFLVGLFASVHCLAMCGGLANAFGLSSPKGTVGNNMLRICAYNGGRIASYALAGLLVGQLGSWLSANAQLIVILRSMAGLILVALGCYLAGWWMGLSLLERAGAVLWRRVQPFTQVLLPIQGSPQAFLLGMLWGWLPCGLVYSVLTWSLLAGDSLQSALIMIMFGLGTLPVMLVSGNLAQQLGKFLGNKRYRYAIAIVIILFGLWTLISAWLGRAYHFH